MLFAGYGVSYQGRQYHEPVSDQTELYVLLGSESPLNDQHDAHLKTEFGGCGQTRGGRPGLPVPNSPYGLCGL